MSEQFTQPTQDANDKASSNEQQAIENFGKNIQLLLLQYGKDFSIRDYIEEYLKRDLDKEENVPPNHDEVIGKFIHVQEEYLGNPVEIYVIIYNESGSAFTQQKNYTKLPELVEISVEIDFPHVSKTLEPTLISDGHFIIGIERDNDTRKLNFTFDTDFGLEFHSENDRQAMEKLFNDWGLAVDWEKILSSEDAPGFEINEIDKVKIIEHISELAQ